MPNQPITPQRTARRMRLCMRAGAFAVAALVVACAMPKHTDSAAPAPDAFDPAAVQLLDDTNWTLTSWRNADGSMRNLTANDNVGHPTIAFSTKTGQRQASGFAGCNRFGGPYALKGGNLVLGPLVITRLACAGAHGELEAGYLDALNHIGKTGLRWRAPRELLIISEDGATLTFTPTGQ